MYSCPEWFFTTGCAFAPKVPLAQILDSWVKWEIQIVCLGRCGKSLPACLSIPDRRVKRAWLSTPPPICNPFRSPPLVYALLIKGAAKSLTKPSPSPHTRTLKHHNPSKIAGTAQTIGAPWERGGRIKHGKTTTEKKKEWRKKKNIHRSNAGEFYWLKELLRSCYTPECLPALPPPTPSFAASFPLWKLWHLL